MKTYKKCSHCNYQRKRQLVKGSSCPKCGYKPVHFLHKLRRALSGLKQKPYTPRCRENKQQLKLDDALNEKITTEKTIT